MMPPSSAARQLLENCLPESRPSKTSCEISHHSASRHTEQQQKASYFSGLAPLLYCRRLYTLCLIIAMSQTAFKLVVAGGIAVASGLLALYKFSIEPIVLDDADGLGLVPGSSSMAGGSLTSSGSVSPDYSSLKRSPSPSPQLGMSRLGSFSTLATLAEEDEEDYEQGYSPLKSSAAAAAASASGAATASAFASEEELDWGDEADSPSKAAGNASSIGATEERGRLEIPPGNLHPRVHPHAILSCDVQSCSCSCGPTKLALTQCTPPSSCASSLIPRPPRLVIVRCNPSRHSFSHVFSFAVCIRPGFSRCRSPLLSARFLRAAVSARCYRRASAHSSSSTPSTGVLMG